MLTCYAQLTEGAAAFGPMLMQQWQEWKADQAKDKAEEREFQLKMRKEAKQEEIERSLKQAQDEISWLKMENSQRRTVSLLDILLLAL